MRGKSSAVGALRGLGALGLALVAFLALSRRRAGGPSHRSVPPAPATGDAGRGAAVEVNELWDRRALEGDTPSGAPRDRLPLDYLALVFALTIPLWVVGGARLPLPIRLPVSAIAIVNPLIAASICTFRQGGWPGVRALFGRALDYRRVRNKRWLLPVLFLYPLIAILSYVVMRLARRPLPADPQVAWLMAPAYLLAFFVAGIGEELGWTAYATDPMQRRWGALRTGIALGLIWAVFHLVPDIQNRQPAGWIVWQRLGGVAFRILILWVYNNTGGSTFTAILFHATNNLAWALFPNAGSHYDPFVTLLLTLPAVGFVILGWDPRTLTRYRFRAKPRAWG